MSDRAPLRRTRAFRRLGRAFLGLCAALILALSAELWLVLRMRAGQRETEAWRKSHASVYDMRYLVEAYPESAWDVEWESYKPGARVAATMDGHEYVVAINSHGFRTREFGLKKPPGTTRIACIGGSTTLEGRTNDETYPALLERRLATRHPEQHIEVLNLGISGSDSAHWLSRLDSLFGFEPDVIVQYEGVNDVFEQLERMADWRLRTLHRSLLLQRLFPLTPLMLDPALKDAAANVDRLARACRDRGVIHLIGTFAVPDPARLDPETRTHLEANLIEKWGPADVKLACYETYAELIARYNRHLEQQAPAAGSRLVPVAQRLTDPALYVDICHKTPEGISGLADAFLPELDATLVDLMEPAPARYRSTPTAILPGSSGRR